MQRVRSGPLRLRRFQLLVYALLGCVLYHATSRASQGDAGQSSTLPRLTAVRDTFIARIKANGFSCPIAPPAIVTDHVASFGNYDDATNVLHIAGWGDLSPEERGLFFRIAGPKADEVAAHAIFEEAVHRWILVHELGHWWQACRHANSAHNSYLVEYGANRIAISYWREADPEFTSRMLSLFHGMVDHVPSPVPQGQVTKAYFNSHYEALSRTPDYAWFQSYMSVAASEERPAPRFATALAETRP